MSLWSSWQNFLAFGRSSSLTPERRQHILCRHRRAFLESLEGRELMAGLTPTDDSSVASDTYVEEAWLTFQPGDSDAGAEPGSAIDGTDDGS